MGFSADRVAALEAGDLAVPAVVAGVSYAERP